MRKLHICVYDCLGMTADGVLFLNIYSYIMISLVSDLSVRFCGGKINGETDQPGEYRAICLWNVEGQALQFYHFWIE